MQVTARLANKARHQERAGGLSQEHCLEVRAKIIRERWETAQMHTPESIQTGLQDILWESPFERCHSVALAPMNYVGLAV